MLLRHVGRFVADVWLFAARSGRVWLLIPVLVLLLAALAVGAVKAAVPTAVYVLF